MGEETENETCVNKEVAVDELKKTPVTAPKPEAKATPAKQVHSRTRYFVAMFITVALVAAAFLVATTYPEMADAGRKTVATHMTLQKAAGAGAAALVAGGCWKVEKVLQARRKKTA